MNAQHSHAQHHLRAIMLATFGFSCWSVGDAFNKLLSTSGVPIYQMIALGGLSGMATIFMTTAARGQIAQLRPKKVIRLLALGLTMPINFGIILLALKYLPLANFYAISFGAPLAVAVLAAWLFKEKLDTRKISAIIAGFIGVLIAVNPETLFSDSSDRIGVIAALASMLIFTGQSLYMRHLSKKETQECTAFYPRMVTVAGGLLGIIIWGWHSTEWHLIAYSLLGGGIGGFGWLAFASAYKKAPAAIVAPFHYSQILTGSLLGYLIFKDVPALHVILGVIIIVASGIYIVMHAKRSSATLKEPIA